MKHNLPYWSRLPDSWKQVLVALGAVIAVLQGIHFIVATPVGIVQGIQYRNQFSAQTWVLREDAAKNQIAAEILGNLNSPFSVGGYYEDCKERFEKYSGFLYGADSERCNSLKTLQEIIDTWAEIYDVPESALPNFYEMLELELWLQVEN
ncbi:hypothetical protein [Halomonas alkalisoli]|uniref:hypothetical protein n=1 Tax=Halomonas alkalisoli TaxID=2907158 RepID=UPI001F25893D|nr:hypothetical protein [Halomonas alkalisoli]MCE9683690.1 hypothetical protein [Halomonas alkalisoli]